MSESTAPTLESLEAFVASIETEDSAARAKLLRLTRAYARILWLQKPVDFARMPTEYGDEAGHYDNSYPPDQEFRAHTGPRLIEVRDSVTKQVATSGGFYYDWKMVTTDVGLFVARDGTIYGAETTGTGSLGQFAAHPGDCDVECEIEWSNRDTDDLTMDDLRAVEEHLRALAFPLVSAKVEGRPS